MQRLEPAFHFADECSELTRQNDSAALEKRIAEQSSELTLRLTEVLELYNVQSQLSEALQVAHEKIVQHEETIAKLISNTKEVRKLEREGAILSQQHAATLLEIEMLKKQLIEMQEALDAEKASTAEALAQLDQLKSEMAAATAERFKLVAMMYGRRRFDA